MSTLRLGSIKIEQTMRIIHSGANEQHDPVGEYYRGRIVPAFENPRRTEEIRAALERMDIGPLEAAEEFPVDRITRIHCPSYVQFLQTAYDEWVALGRSGDATPAVWTMRGIRPNHVPESLDGRLAYYSFDVMTPITAGTWAVAKGAADAALTGAGHISAGRARSLFVLSRPPGHHAACDCYGGYSFLNNAAIAAQHLLDNGARRIGILDIDYHHGNGTQQIFYARRDVFYASIHAHPTSDFPYLQGYADETGTGDGEGFNGNFPLPRGTGWSEWSQALHSAQTKLEAFDPDAIIISLGVDTFDGDPLGSFRLNVDDYFRVGEHLAKLKQPVLFIMEGGYATGAIGTNVANVLAGFDRVQ